MAFKAEEFDMMLNDYGIVVSERTRRLIHRNNMKNLALKKQQTSNTNVFNIIKQSILWCLSMLSFTFTCMMWFMALLCWIVLYIIKKTLEWVMVVVIIKIVSEYIKTNGQLQSPVN